MDQYALSTDLKKQLVPQLFQLVLSPEGHRDWSTFLAACSQGLTPSGKLQYRRTPSRRWRTTVRKRILRPSTQVQTFFSSTDQRTQSPLHRPDCHFRVHTPSGKTQSRTLYLEMHSDVKRFFCVVRRPARHPFGQTPLSSPDVVLYTDGSTSLASGCTGVRYLTSSSAPTASLWGAVITDRSDPSWI